VRRASTRSLGGHSFERVTVEIGDEPRLTAPGAVDLAGEAARRAAPQPEPEQGGRVEATGTLIVPYLHVIRAGDTLASSHPARAHEPGEVQAGRWLRSSSPPSLGGCQCGARPRRPGSFRSGSGFRRRLRVSSGRLRSGRVLSAPAGCSASGATASSSSSGVTAELADSYMLGEAAEPSELVIATRRHAGEDSVKGLPFAPGFACWSDNPCARAFPAPFEPVSELTRIELRHLTQPRDRS